MFPDFLHHFEDLTLDQAAVNNDHSEAASSAGLTTNTETFQLYRMHQFLFNVLTPHTIVKFEPKMLDRERLEITRLVHDVAVTLLQGSIDFLLIAVGSNHMLSIQESAKGSHIIMSAAVIDQLHSISGNSLSWDEVPYNIYKVGAISHLSTDHRNVGFTYKWGEARRGSSREAHCTTCRVAGRMARASSVTSTGQVMS